MDPADAPDARPGVASRGSASAIEAGRACDGTSHSRAAHRPPLGLEGPGARAWQAIIADPGAVLLCSDFDGVLSPIVADPDTAVADPRAVAALDRLAVAGVGVAVVTGRPARKAVQLGSFTEHAGLASMSVHGLYGSEQWDAATGVYTEPDAPAGMAAAREALPGVLREAGVPGARVEDKRLSLGVHTRELPDPAGALDALRAPLAALAERTGLQVEPGRNVIELRAPGTDKGATVRRLVAERRPQVVVYAGDDLGDVPAFDAVRALRTRGDVEGLLICSGSEEQDALVELADVVVEGPAGVADLLHRLADAVDADRVRPATAGPDGA